MSEPPEDTHPSRPASREQSARSEDVVLPHSPTEDGRGWNVLRRRGERLEAGVLHPAREGQPIHGELVRLSPREGTPLCDVEVLHDARPPTERPALVASARYRDGWERIWGDRPDRALH